MTFKDINSLGKERKPFLFISDFLAQKIEVIPLDELEQHDIEFCIDENYIYKKHARVFRDKIEEFDSYKTKFDEVIEHIKSGDTYLLNLTAQTKVESTLTLQEIYNCANAHYKLRYRDKFVCFSPEKFIHRSRWERPHPLKLERLSAICSRDPHHNRLSCRTAFLFIMDVILQGQLTCKGLIWIDQI